MTRLTGEDIREVSPGLAEYDRELKEKTGLDLLGLACRAAGLDLWEAARLIPDHPVGVVSLTCGQGLIPGFGATLARIARHLGFPAQAQQNPDAAGLAQAVAGGARIILTADDDRYVALNLEQRYVADNGEATGRGFALALDGLAGGLAGKEALILGCGPVGRAGALALLELGVRVSVCDLDQALARSFCQRTGARQVQEVEAGLAAHRHILEATTAPDLIREEHFTDQTRVAAPGVPCGVEAGALAKHGARIIHDPLQIGTATMLLMALKGASTRVSP